MANSTNFRAGAESPTGSVFGSEATTGASGAGRLGDSMGEAGLAEDLAGIRSSAIWATRARNGLGLAPSGDDGAGGGTAAGFPVSMSDALIRGGVSGAANSTNVGCEGSAAGSFGAGASVGGSAVGRFKRAMGGAGAASTGAISTGVCSTGGASTDAAFADSTSGRTRESMVSPAGIAGSSSASTAVPIAAEECPFVKPKSRYCCGAAASSGTEGTARSCSTIANTPLVTANTPLVPDTTPLATDTTPLVPPACPCAQEGHSRTAGEQSRPQSGQIQHNIY